MNALFLVRIAGVEALRLVDEDVRRLVEGVLFLIYICIYVCIDVCIYVCM